MRPLRYSINVTLDGCCDHRGILPDEDLHRHATENLQQADALLFGRVTYEMMEAAFRPPAGTGARPDWMEPFARTIDAAKKYVVSSTLDCVDWNAELVRGDLGKAVQQLKRESGKGLFVGRVKLPLALAELGLIDEYEFVGHPRLAGHGPTLFAGLSKHIDLKLVSRLESARGRWRCGMSLEGSHRSLARVGRKATPARPSKGSTDPNRLPQWPAGSATPRAGCDQTYSRQPATDAVLNDLLGNGAALDATGPSGALCGSSSQEHLIVAIEV
jgi:dihydrofolate reductase